ncbi:MAG: acyltransferase [Oscillospiraceae bacterium]|nr:acyltransferase [Oscillospiraceae bacterium]
MEKAIKPPPVKLGENGRNHAVDVFRYVCAVLVVSIHTHPFEEINYNAGFFASQIITRVAVPFFFAVAGYFYIGSLLAGTRVLWKYIKKLVFVYTFWSVFYFIISYYRYHRAEMSVGAFITGRVIQDYFFRGSEYHLWFFPALIFSVLMAAWLKKLRLMKIFAYISPLLFAVGCLSLAYKNVAAQVPVLAGIFGWSEFTAFRRILLTGFPFFMTGYFLNAFKSKWEKLSNKKMLTMIFICGAGFLLEILFILLFLLPDDITLTFMLYPLLFSLMIFLLNNPFPQGAGVSEGFRVTANVTFYMHPAFIILFRFLGAKLFGVAVPNTIMFLAVCTAVGALGLAIYKIDSKFLNRLVA